MAKRQYALAATQYKEAQDLQPSRPDLVAKWQVAYGKIQEKSRVLQKTP
jgi:hypothetical protein